MMKKVTLFLLAALALPCFVSPAHADTSDLRARLESSGAATVRRLSPCRISGRGRSWANATAISVEGGAGLERKDGIYLYFQDTKSDVSGEFFPGGKTDAVGLYTSSAYLDNKEVDGLLKYLDATILKYREIQGKDMGLVSYSYALAEDGTLEMSVVGKRQEFSLYSSGKLLRGQSFAVANRQLKVTLVGVEEFEKLRDYLKESITWQKSVK
ncbi:hypothetical protein [Armatimonas sp.]|uniref:hypothetical protein n=1 Tax=Armatimonas sp. TaxID=1872638 RepID=UPI00375025D1